MFLAHIAFALNLIALAVGAFLVGWGMYKAEKCAALYTNVNPSVNQNMHEGAKTCSTKGRCATTFAKIIGIIVMLLAIAGMICTVVFAAKVKHYWHEKREMMEQNTSDQNNSTPGTPSATPE